MISLGRVVSCAHTHVEKQALLIRVHSIEVIWYKGMFKKHLKDVHSDMDQCKDNTFGDKTRRKITLKAKGKRIVELDENNYSGSYDTDTCSVSK